MVKGLSVPDSQFDVFLCHNSKDKPQVKVIGLQLRQLGLRVWLDEWELRPGLPWQPALEDRIEEIGAAAVFVGPDGIGPWQDIEIQAYLREFVRRRCPVIPVILDRVGDRPRLPLFLRGHTWVDFRKTEPVPLHQLYYGITGDRTVPAPSSQQPAEVKTVTPSPVESTPAKPANKASERQQLEKIDLGNGVVLELVSISDGTFLMGSPQDEEGYHESQAPQHEATISNFWMGKFPVTQAQWKIVVGWSKVNRDLKLAPSHLEGENRPVEKVSWHDAQEFCDRLSAKTNRAFRLPSEAEWEYACRAGTTTPYFFGENLTSNMASYGGKYGGTTDVGKFPANDFGLYDMHGNVYEWCEDVWHENYGGAPPGGTPWIKGGDSSRRVLRGGSWNSNARKCRSAYRVGYGPAFRYSFIGFRVVCSSA